ncbi:MAG: T9SS type A sorting domain-containing protein [Prolixibacteraceae bacterium]|nr:T9SS type A sorting domain-containing protein [Prolixibacteraceae bacterium]
MKNKILPAFFFLLIILASVLFSPTSLNAQSITIFDPETFDPADLPAGMEIVENNGYTNLQVILNGWNSVLDIPEVSIDSSMIATINFKYTMCDATAATYSLDDIRGTVQLMDTINKVDDPWNPGLMPSKTGMIQDPVTGVWEWSTADVVSTMQMVHQIQFFSQEKTTWGANTGDTIWVGKIEAVKYPSHTEIFKTETAPVIDGTEDAVWANAQAHPLELNYRKNTPTVEAYWKAMWCDSGMFVLINVLDDDHWPSWEVGGNPWDYDHGEVYFDVNENLDDGLGAADGDGHYQSAPAFADGSYGVTQTNPTSNNIPGDIYAYQLDGENWVREHFFKFNNFLDYFGFPLDKSGFLNLSQIGFDVCINDQDEGVTTSPQTKVWHNFGRVTSNWYNMDDAGTIALVEGPTNITDSLALVALYNATDGDNWAHNANWLTGYVDTWYGITVTDGRVTEINLRNNYLTGSLPPEIGNFSELKKLYLSNNVITGTIPAELWNLTNLIELDLVINQLTGSIPSDVEDLINLVVLNLQQNQLSGSIPAEVGSLTNLEDLDFTFNELTGNIPAEIGNLSNLSWLGFGHNQLYGNLPDLTGLSNLSFFWLYARNNFFTFSNIEASGLLPGDINTFNYSPQDTLLAIQQDGSNLTVIDGNATNNQYQWYKDDVLLTADTRTIATEGPGEYRAKVDNTDYPDLTLYSDTLTVGTPVVPDNEQVSNYALSDGNYDCINALNTITVAGDGTTVDFFSGSSVTLIAGHSINFLHGFHAHSGSYMDAHITTNNTFCDDLPEQAIVEYTAPETYKSKTVEEERINKNIIGEEPMMAVFPNPNSGQFNIKLNNFNGETRLIMFNTMGQKVYDETVNEKQITVGLPHIKQGLYFIKAINNNKQYDQKIVIK